MQYYNLYKLQYISIINYINHNLVVNHYSKINPSPASTGSEPDQPKIRQPQLKPATDPNPAQSQPASQNSQSQTGIKPDPDHRSDPETDSAQLSSGSTQAYLKASL